MEHRSAFERMAPTQLAPPALAGVAGQRLCEVAAHFGGLGRHSASLPKDEELQGEQGGSAACPHAVAGALHVQAYTTCPPARSCLWEL